MGIEIERKFLVSSDGWRTAAHRVIPMAQGYINDMGALDRGTQNASVRVRIEGDHAALNLKSRTIGHTRQEFDYPIPVEDARALLALCVGGLIDKRRHLVEHAGLTWEVDEFLGDNAGLVVAESSWTAPTRRSTCRTGSPKSPTTRATTTSRWPVIPIHSGEPQKGDGGD
jgi:adenylate cyclase